MEGIQSISKATKISMQGCENHNPRIKRVSKDDSTNDILLQIEGFIFESPLCKTGK